MKEKKKNLVTFTVRVYFDRDMNLDTAVLNASIRRLSHMPGAIRGPWQIIASKEIKKRFMLLGYTTIRLAIPLDTLSTFGEYAISVQGCEYDLIEMENSPDSFIDYWDGGLTDKTIYVKLIK